MMVLLLRMVLLLILCKILFLLIAIEFKILEFIRLKQGTRLIFDLMVVIFMLNNIQLKSQI